MAALAKDKLDRRSARSRSAGGEDPRPRHRDVATPHSSAHLGSSLSCIDVLDRRLLARAEDRSEERRPIRCATASFCRRATRRWRSTPRSP